MRVSPRRLVIATSSLSVALCAAAAPAATASGGGAEPGVGVDSVLAAPAGAMTSGPRLNGTAVLPDGRLLTPAGRSVAVQLQPFNSVLSHDGRRLYVSSEGRDDDQAAGPTVRYVTVLDTATQTSTLIRDDDLHYGLAESTDGLTLYVSEGRTDSVGVFRRTKASDGGTGTFAKIATWPLNPSSPKDYPWGLTLSGGRLYVVGFLGNTLTTVDAATGAVLGRVSTGAFPYDVVASPDGHRVYVSNWGLYNADASLGRTIPVSPPPATLGGYNTTASSSVWTYDVTAATPAVVAKTRIGRDLNGQSVNGGSLPSGLGLSPDGNTLAVTASNNDLVELLDTRTTTPNLGEPTTSGHPVRVVDLRAVVGTPALPAPTGSQPDASTWSADGTALFVAEGERNSIAVIDPAKVATTAAVDPASLTGAGPGTSAAPNRAAVIGRFPTAWYPTSLTVSADGAHLFVTSEEGLGSGPNGGAGRPRQPIGDTSRGRVSDISLAGACADLAQLTRTSDTDNGLVAASPATAGDGAVVPLHYGASASSAIKHVFLVIKENRPFDNVFGDYPRAESDNSLADYGQYVTPNQHSLADHFTLADNYDATARTSTEGHYSIDTGQVDEFVEKVTPSAYDNRIPGGAFDTTPENVPEAGFIWNNAARHGVSTTVFGEATFVVGVSPQLLGQSPTTTSAGQVLPGVQSDALTTYDPLYPSQVNLQGNLGPARPVGNVVYAYNDEARADEFDRAVAANRLSTLNVMILFDDHTDGDIAGAQTPERRVAENDHALGRVVDTLSHSSYWNDSAMFVTEDDTQGGSDHVDAYRTYGLLASPYAKRGYVAHGHASFSAMTKTINLLLGLPPTSLQEMTSTSLADWFLPAGTAPDSTPYTALANNTQPAVNRSVATARNPVERAAAQLALRVPRGVDRGGALLPIDLHLAHEGQRLAGDPNVKPEPAVVRHTLVQRGPAAVTGSGTDGPAGSADPIATCLAGGDATTPALPEVAWPVLLLAAAAVLAAASLRRARFRRRRPPPTPAC